MRIRTHIAAFVFACSGTALAQSYPEKTVVMVTPFPAGGSVDLVARAVAQQMSDAWKQPVIDTESAERRRCTGEYAVRPATPDILRLDAKAAHRPLRVVG